MCKDLLCLGQPQLGMQGIFTTTVAFTEGGGMAFAPDHHGVLEVINTNVLEGCLALASAAPRLITMRTFAQHFCGKPAGLHIATIVRLKPM